MDVDIEEELKVISRDLGHLAQVYRLDEDDCSLVLRMLASKWEHVARLFRQSADKMDRERAKL